MKVPADNYVVKSTCSQILKLAHFLYEEFVNLRFEKQMNKIKIKNVGKPFNCVFWHDVLAALFVFQNNETAATFVSQTSVVGVELFPYVNALSCSNKFA